MNVRLLLSPRDPERLPLRVPRVRVQGVGVPVQFAPPPGHGVGVEVPGLLITFVKSVLIVALVLCDAFQPGTVGNSDAFKADCAAMSLRSFVSCVVGAVNIRWSHASTALKFQSSNAWLLFGLDSL